MPAATPGHALLGFDRYSQVQIHLFSSFLISLLLHDPQQVISWAQQRTEKGRNSREVASETWTLTQIYLLIIVRDLILVEPHGQMLRQEDGWALLRRAPCNLLQGIGTSTLFAEAKYRQLGSELILRHPVGLCSQTQPVTSGRQTQINL